MHLASQHSLTHTDLSVVALIRDQKGNNTLARLCMCWNHWTSFLPDVLMRQGEPWVISVSLQLPWSKGKEHVEAIFTDYLLIKLHLGGIKIMYASWMLFESIYTTLLRYLISFPSKKHKVANLGHQLIRISSKFSLIFLRSNSKFLPVQILLWCVI